MRADLSSQFPAGGGHEPLPLRLLRRSDQTLHLFFFSGDALPEAHLRSLAGPHRYPR